MSSESEKDTERLVQAAKTFFLHMQDFTSFTNTLTELFNSSMNTQIISMAVKEDGYIKDVFEQMLKIFKEMKSVLDSKDDKKQQDLFSKVAAAMSSVLEKSTNVKELHQSAKEELKNIHIPAIVSLLNSSNVFGILESSLSLLMKHPIINLKLSDFCRKDTKEQSDATTSEKSPSAGPSKTTTIDTVKKLQDALKIENAMTTMQSAADQLEQIVKTLRPILEILQKAVKTMEMSTSGSKKASD
ncbi:PREDICTED: uncharacterized protein C12orf60 homolog [Miniopterus natalensis]|uniref:uncharacterized protein C12orf60 homolog n=1 Tax=Miniopterus natalensis TaxID=291302 RepID=UPI0007A6CD7C|nr:PREDICTED: uncharacterized protein C12orf60 homolog [Miniopterus natalensis]XP_016052992.1 PREDICTED: uncharacterized protein C12orf60 homolog [Miniopterus natalensis]